MSIGLDTQVVHLRRVLVKACLALLNKNKNAPLREIASHAGVARATLYRLFNNRQNLIEATACYCLNRLVSATSFKQEDARTGMDAFRLLFKNLMPRTQEFQFLINHKQIMLDDPEIRVAYQQLRTEILALVEFAKREGSINNALLSSWVINLIQGLLLAGWLQQREDASNADTLAMLAFECFSAGVNGAITGGSTRVPA